jgi:hypothetical protein
MLSKLFSVYFLGYSHGHPESLHLKYWAAAALSLVCWQPGIGRKYQALEDDDDISLLI